MDYNSSRYLIIKNKRLILSHKSYNENRIIDLCNNKRALVINEGMKQIKDKVCSV